MGIIYWSSIVEIEDISFFYQFPQAVFHSTHLSDELRILIRSILTFFYDYDHVNFIHSYLAHLFAFPTVIHFFFVIFYLLSSWYSKIWSLDLDQLALSLLISFQFKKLASLNSQHSLRSAAGLDTFKPQHDLLCSFSLFPENWLSLPSCFLS